MSIEVTARLRDGRSDLEFQVLRGEQHCWLRLSEGGPGRVLRVWSKAEPVADLEALVIVLVVFDHLEEVGYRPGGLHIEATEFWPPGWDLWGPGQPEPIADYLVWGSFDHDAEQVPVVPIR